MQEIKIIGLIPFSTHRKRWQIIWSRHNRYERRSDGFGHRTHWIKRTNQLPQGTIRLLATAGEEKEQEGAKLLADKGYLDDVDGLMIAEPTGSGIYYAHKGSMSCKVTATGKAVHSSVPFIGDNAIDTLLEFYNQFKEKYAELKKMILNMS